MKKYKKLNWDEDDLESLPNGDLKKLGDYWMRVYVLENAEKRNGKYYCPLKEQWYAEDRMHLCHYIDRGIIKHRFDLDNVHLISSVSNTFEAQIPAVGFKSKHHKEYEEYLILKIGEKKFNNLLGSKNNLTIFTQADYIRVIKQFRNE